MTSPSYTMRQPQITRTSTSSVTIPRSTSQDDPHPLFQLNNDLLYEREFERGAYVSAHLQRLQNGCFADSKIHRSHLLYVTFAAIKFTFHPVTSSGNSDYRFESAVIEIRAKNQGGTDGGDRGSDRLRFVKYAPHMAFGRISAAHLRWNFKLGASIGVTQGPASIGLTPEAEYEKDLVVGTMMKIQGSSRSSLPSFSPMHHRSKQEPDTRLVWTLEENTQQKAGIPREFTFVFLMERPNTSSFEDRNHLNGRNRRASASHEVLYKPMPKSMRNESSTIEAIDTNDQSRRALDDNASRTQPLSLTLESFNPSNFPSPSFFEHHAQHTTIEGEVGQKFTEMALGDGLESEKATGGVIFNFARLSGSFEDLIELPGNTTTTTEPIIPLQAKE